MRSRVLRGRRRERRDQGYGGVGCAVCSATRPRCSRLSRLAMRVARASRITLSTRRNLKVSGFERCTVYVATLSLNLLAREGLKASRFKLKATK